MAFCNSCSSNNCSCTSYTLPTGSTGATGATGATGPTGTPGAVVIFNQAIDVDTSTTSSEVLYTYTLSNPSPIDEAGDILVIKSFWSTNAASSTATKIVKIKFGGNDISPNGITTYPALGSGIHSVHYEIHLSRITSTTAAVDVFIKYIGPFGIVGAGLALHSPNVNYATVQTVPNLDSGAQAITFEADGSTAGDITIDRIIIAKLEKV